MILHEQITHGSNLLFLTFIFNSSLLVHVFQQERRIGEQINWKMGWRMMVQLLGICSLLLIQLVQLIRSPEFGIDASSSIYLLSLCLPPAPALVCLGVLKEIRQHAKIRYPLQYRVGDTNLYQLIPSKNNRNDEILLLETFFED